MAEAQTPANVQGHSNSRSPSNDPDPSVLATQQLWREIAHLKELTNTRIDYIEKAVALAHEDLQRFPTNIDKAIGQLKNVHEEKFKVLEVSLNGEHNLKEEKFNKVEQRFQLIETTRIEQKAEAANALTTALTAAKDVINEQSRNTIAAAAKSELATAKQIDQMHGLITSLTKTFDDKVADVKERVTKIESIATGKKDFWGYIVGAIGLLATLISIIAMIIKNSNAISDAAGR